MGGAGLPAAFSSRQADWRACRRARPARAGGARGPSSAEASAARRRFQASGGSIQKLGHGARPSPRPTH
eukprot:6853814-Pyramimonas_sp.AAC.1